MEEKFLLIGEFSYIYKPKRLICSYKKSLMNINQVSQINPSIDQCKIHLHYSARSEEPYWLNVNIYLYKDNQRQNILFLGPGSKNEANELYKQIEALGFYQSGQRFDYEWLVVTFMRVEKET